MSTNAYEPVTDFTMNLRDIGNQYLLCGIGWFVVFVLGLPLVLSEFSSSGFYHSTVIAWTHVMTLGILTQLLMGIRTRRWRHALNRPGPSRGWSWVELMGFNGGLIWFLMSMIFLWHRWQLTLAATVLGTTLMAGGMTRMLRTLRGRLPLAVKLSDSLAWLGLAGMGFLGFSLAHSKWLGFMGEGLTLHWIKTHFVIGASGWFGPLLLAVSLPTTTNSGSSGSKQTMGLFILAAMIFGQSLAMVGIWAGSDAWVRGALLVWFAALLSWGYILYGRMRSFPLDPAAGGEAWLGFGMIYLLIGLLLPLMGAGLRASITGTIFILIGLFHVEVGFLPSGTNPEPRTPCSSTSDSNFREPITSSSATGPGAWPLGLAHLGLVLMILSQWSASLVLLVGAWLLFSGGMFTSLGQRWSAMYGEPTRS